MVEFGVVDDRPLRGGEKVAVGTGRLRNWLQLGEQARRLGQPFVSVVYSAAMAQAIQRTRFLVPVQALHLTMAGFYAFVLPFICWGVLATPGHAHARPHFVFIDPPAAVPVPPASMSLEELVAWNLQHMGCGPSAHASHAASAGSDSPMGQSLPTVLVGALLLLIIPLAALGMRLAGPSQFSTWLCALLGRAVTLRPTPPPPRLGLRWFIRPGSVFNPVVFDRNPVAAAWVFAR